MEAFRKVRIDWRRKAVAFRAFNTLPGGRRLYYLTQRYVTRTFPRNLADHSKWPIEHARIFRESYVGDIGRARLFEFGVGWDLHNNLVQWCYGVNHQIVVDIVRWARVDQINHAIRFLQHNPPPGFARLPEIPLTAPFESPLASVYGIRYVAPADARCTGIDDGAIDLMCTTSVLEHIPVAPLQDILRECHRICSRRGVMSHVIDYTDHYAHSDASINIYNFLRFSDEEWKRFNPDIHYQNRLRHFEYGDLFRKAGFVPVAEKAIQSENSEQLLAEILLWDRFRAMTVEQLLPRTGHWVLQKE